MCRHHRLSISKNQTCITTSIDQLKACKDTEAIVSHTFTDINEVDAMQLAETISLRLREQEICSNLVCVLGSLLLKGGDKRHSVLGENASLSYVVSSLSYDILCTLNCIARLDLHSLQSLPKDMTVIHSLLLLVKIC
jgi:hypothetical protein